MFHTDLDKRSVRSFRLLGAAAALLLGLPAGAAMPQASSPLDKLRIWEGHWTLKIRAT